MRTNILISTVLLLAAAACTQNLSTDSVKADADAQSVLPQHLYATLQAGPQTKSVIGEFDSETESYPLSFDDDDWITVYGLAEDGEIELDADNYISNYTFYAIYQPDEDNVGNAFKLVYSYSSNEYADMAAAYDATEVFLLMPDYPVEIKLGGEIAANSSAVTGDVLLYAGKLDKTGFETFSGNWLPEGGPVSEDKCIPLRVINSLIKVTLDGSDLTQDLDLDFLDIVSNSNGSLDFSKITDVFNDMVFYAEKNESTGKFISYKFGTGAVLKAGASNAYYVGAVPGTYDSYSFMVAFEAGDRICVAKREAKSAVTFDAGALYDVTIKITDEFIASRGIYYPMFNYNGAKYDIYDQPYGPEMVKYNNCDLFAIQGMLNAGVEAVLVSGDGEPNDFGTSVEGKIAVVSRGGISFSDKVINACEAGAVGIIVANNQAGPLYMGLDAVPDHQWIPALGAPQTFMTAFAADATGKLTIGDISLLSGETFITVGGIKFPVGSTKTKALSYEQTIAAFETIVSGSPEYVLIPGNDFTKVGDLTGKIAVLEFQPIDSPALAVNAIAKGAAAMIVPCNYNEYNKIPNADCSSSSAEIGDFCIVRIEGSFPAFLKYKH